MADSRVCENCEKNWTISYFSSCLVSNSVLTQNSTAITFGCVAQLLAFIRNSQFDVHQPCSSSCDPSYRAFADILQQIASLSCDTHRKLKDKIPEIRNVIRSMKAVQEKCPTGWCCLPADIVYVNVKQPLSGAERAKRARQNVAYQQSEKARLKGKRSDVLYQQSEKDRGIKRKQDDTFRQCEQARAKKRRKEVSPTTVDDLIKQFHATVECAPMHVCGSCDQLFYRHSVKSASGLYALTAPRVHTTLLGTISESNAEWVCNTCYRYLKRNRLPPMAIANNLEFPPVPQGLPELTSHEWRVLSPRLAFMKIYEAPVGKQLKVYGNVVNVVSDCMSTVHMLPRCSNQFETVALQFKRKSQYKHAFLSANIRPNCIRTVGKYLSEHGELFKHEQIEFSDSHLETVQSEQADILSQVAATENNDNNQSENNQSVDNVHQDEDNWDEIIDSHDERAGIFDTLFTSPEFVEDTERSAVYSFSPAEKNKPISIFVDKYSEELAYPNIWFGDSRPENHEVNVHYSDIVKSELRRADRRVAMCVDNIFYKLKKVQMHSLTGQISVAVRKRKTGGKTLTAGELKLQGGVDSLIQLDCGYRILKQLRGSPPYWEAAQRDLLAMIRQLGPATLFMTLSAAETRWLFLLKQLSRIVDNKHLTDEECKQLTWSEKCRLINSDPVTCSRHFHYCVQAFLTKFLNSPASPFGRLVDWWLRVEFQHRGSPHIHMLVWIDGAPVYGEADNAEIVEYVDKIITCQKDLGSPELNSLTDLQTHRHTRTCRKQIKKSTVCRFGFPKYPMKQTVILMPMSSAPDDDIQEQSKKLQLIKSTLSEIKPTDEEMSWSEFLHRISMTYDEYLLVIRKSLKSDTLFIRRSLAEIRVNNYNVQCLTAWRANMDIQIILDVFGCASYVCSYVAKSSRGMSELLQKACKEAKQGQMNLKQQFRRIANKFVNNVEISAQEAVYLLLQLPLKQSSRQVVFINTGLPEERIYLIRNDVTQVSDDTEVASDNLISRYTQRSKQLETVTLADYAAWYDKTGGEPASEQTVDDDDQLLCDDSHDTAGGQKSLKKRRRPRIIRYVRFAVGEPEKHYREKLMLFTHWRNEETDLLGGFPSFEERYKHIKSELTEQIKAYEPFSDAVDNAEIALAADAPEEEWDELAPGAQHMERESERLGDSEAVEFASVNPQAHNQPGEYDIGVDIGLAGVNATDALTRFDMPDDQYYELMRSLNVQQLELLYDTVKLLKTTDQQLMRFVSGGAGTGKSYLLRALRETIERFFRSKNNTDFTQQCCMTIAPTGKAAFLAGGNTVHSVMHIPANQALQYRRLDHDSLNTVRTQIGHIKVWLIDEISMVGNRMFTFIDQRLQEVNNNNRPFGGASVIAFGDLYQLAPVMDGYVFQDMSVSNKLTDYSALAPNLWTRYFTMFELTTVMRQQDCLPYAQLLNRLREGNQTDEDIAVLRDRIITTEDASYPVSAQHLFRTNESVDRHNSWMFATSTQLKYEIKSIDTVVGTISGEMCAQLMSMIPVDARKTMQLPGCINIVVHGRYELSCNVDVGDGMANGASGTVMAVSSASGKASGIVWMHFDDDIVGKQIRNQSRKLYTVGIDSTWTPVLPLSRQFQVGRSKANQVIRKQFPLRHSAAKTIHRCQGDTLSEVVVDFSTKRKEPHTHYVGLSRVKSLEGLFVLNLAEDKMQVSETVRDEMKLLRSDRKLSLSMQFPYAFSDTYTQIAFLNARSLHKHICDVRHDFGLMACDMVAFCETRLMLSDIVDTTYILPEYALSVYEGGVFSEGPSVSRSHYGLAVYSRLSVKQSFQPVAMSKQLPLECVVTRVDLKPDIVLNVVCLYRQGSSSVQQFKCAFELLKQKLDSIDSDDCQQYTLVMGDFNLDWLQESTQVLMAQLLPGYRQLVNTVTTDYNSILDHAYTNLPVDAVMCYTTECYYSDHKPVVCAVRL